MYILGQDRSLISMSALLSFGYIHGLYGNPLPLSLPSYLLSAVGLDQVNNASQ